MPKASKATEATKAPKPPKPVLKGDPPPDDPQTGGGSKGDRNGIVKPRR